jgi:polyhydroxybutyrate depolymerase
MRLRRCFVPAFAAFAALTTLAACNSSGTSATPAAPTTIAPTTITPTTAATPAPAGTTKPTVSPTTAVPTACHAAPGFGPGTTTHHIVVAGARRDFLVHMPPRPTAGMRLVVDFHGATSDMYAQDVYSGFDPVADQHDFVVATPNGIDAAVRQWRFLGTLDDVNFAVAVVRTLVRDACVDRAHAYAVGISSGGAMSASLACQASDTFAGFGLVAADFYLAPICDKAHRRPIIIFHGTADPLVPYNGGTVGGTSTPVQPAETSAALWARHNGCTPGPTETTLGSQVVRLTWKGCVAPVVMYRIVGGGHTWPGAAINAKGLGLTTKQVSASAEMWKFFASS